MTRSSREAAVQRRRGWLAFVLALVVSVGVWTPGVAADRGDHRAPPAAVAAGVPVGGRLHVLWVGNSLTDTAPDIGDYSIGPMPARLAPMLAELGVSLTFEAVIQGGAQLSDHARNARTLALISSPRFDAVALQGYYEGFAGTAADYLAAVGPLYRTARAAGATVMFQQIWSFIDDPGSAQFPAAALAVEAAASQSPGAVPVQVMRVWNAVRERYPALHARLYHDSTHQSVIGEYLNALTYARFFTGRSVRGITSVHPSAAARLSLAERLALKAVVDEQVRVFFPVVRGAALSPATLWHAGAWSR